jgi:hypothetical protein
MQKMTYNANANAKMLIGYYPMTSLTRFLSPYSAPIILFGKNAQTVPITARIEQTTIKK